jgi:hypothetical protein
VHALDRRRELGRRPTRTRPRVRLLTDDHGLHSRSVRLCRCANTPTDLRGFLT